MGAWAEYVTFDPPANGWEDVRMALQAELAAFLLATTFSGLGTLAAPETASSQPE